MIFSGNANNGSNAGLSYSNTNNTPSGSNANIRSQLCLINFKTDIGHASWQKITKQKGVGTGNGKAPSM